MTQTVSVFYSTTELPKLIIFNHVSLFKIIYEIYISYLGILMGSSINIYYLNINKISIKL